MADRVLLINPSYPLAETPSPPLGLAYLAGVLEDAGVTVRILDLVVYPQNQTTIADLLEQFQPEVVGITAVTMTAETAFAIIREVKRVASDVLTVMGGPHVTFSTEATLSAVPALDVIVRGEGELTFPALLENTDRREHWETIAGLAFRKNGGICHTPWREPIRDLSSLPEPARHGLPLGRYRTLGMPVSVTTSRGCPFQCVFCVGRRMVGSRVRYRSPLQVVDEIEGLAARGFRQVNIADDLFTANAKHCFAICDEINRRNLKIRWSSFARVDTVSVPLLTRMHEAGCHAVSFGMESGNPDILKRVRKQISLSQAEAAVAMCRQAGMEAHASFILGLPGETPETLAQTMAFAKRLEQQGLSYGFHLLAPFPGTAIGDNPGAFDLRVLSRHWPDYHANRAICEPLGLKREALDAIAIEWETRLKDYLDDIGRRIVSNEASDDERQQIRNMERTVILHELMMAEALEKTASFQNAMTPSTPSRTAIDDLADRVSRYLPDWPVKKINDALHHAQDLNGLRLETQSEGKTSWQWVDFLPE